MKNEQPPINNLDSRYEMLINSDVNVSKTSDVVEFFKFLLIIAVICVILFFVIDFSGTMYILNIPLAKKIEIENLLTKNPDKSVAENLNGTIADAKTIEKYRVKLDYANLALQNIIKRDKNLQNNPNINITLINSKTVNACVILNGKIYVTTAILDEVENNYELVFLIAHELGHYSKRHILQNMSKTVAMSTVLTILNCVTQSDLAKMTSSSADLGLMQYSQIFEREADAYASRMLIGIAGSNIYGIKFLKKLEGKNALSEFAYFFSTHPSPDTRIELLKKINNKRY